MNRKNLLLSTLLRTSILVGVVEFYLDSRGEFLTEKTQTVWGVFFGVKHNVGLRGHQNHDRPLDFGFHMYIFWPIAFPYYLLATRRLEGGVIHVGFFGHLGWPLVCGSCGLCLLLLVILMVSVEPLAHVEPRRRLRLGNVVISRFGKHG